MPKNYSRELESDVEDVVIREKERFFDNGVYFRHFNFLLSSTSHEHVDLNFFSRNMTECIIGIMLSTEKPLLECILHNLYYPTFQ